ncbi:hypothetical protein SNE40_013015 [Patella caerulea]|uniref:Uncharacterized protein n=1 Tax=Patella caerulea TaxID=87958 RepID=A0AAN8JMQ2_PATCE
MGKKGGVAAKLKNDVPYVITIPCIAHRLELAMKNAAKSLPLVNSLEKLMENVYKFYHYSPLNWTGLQETGNALNIKVLRPVNIYVTRLAGRNAGVCAMLSDVFQNNDTSIDLIPIMMHAASAKLTETDIDKMATDFLQEKVVDDTYRTVHLEKSKKRGPGSTTDAAIFNRVKSEFKTLLKTQPKPCLQE